MPVDVVSERIEIVVNCLTRVNEITTAFVVSGQQHRVKPVVRCCRIFLVFYDLVNHGSKLLCVVHRDTAVEDIDHRNAVLSDYIHFSVIHICCRVDVLVRMDMLVECRNHVRIAYDQDERGRDFPAVVSRSDVFPYALGGG